MFGPEPPKVIFGDAFHRPSSECVNQSFKITEIQQKLTLKKISTILFDFPGSSAGKESACNLADPDSFHSRVWKIP